MLVIYNNHPQIHKTGMHQNWKKASVYKDEVQQNLKCVVKQFMGWMNGI